MDNPQRVGKDISGCARNPSRQHMVHAAVGEHVRYSDERPRVQKKKERGSCFSLIRAYVTHHGDTPAGLTPARSTCFCDKYVLVPLYTVKYIDLGRVAFDERPVCERYDWCTLM